MCSSCRAEDLVWIAAEKQSLPGPSALLPSDVQSDGRDGLVAELWSETVRSRARVCMFVFVMASNSCVYSYMSMVMNSCSSVL